MIPSLLENVCEPERLDAEEFANLQTAFKIQSGFIMRAGVKKKYGKYLRVIHTEWFLTD